MADIRIKDLPTTATQTASDDFIALDGTVNGTRKIDASAPSFKTSVTSPSIVAPAATNLTLTGGTTGASLVLGQGTTAANITIAPSGTGYVDVTKRFYSSISFPAPTGMLDNLGTLVGPAGTGSSFAVNVPSVSSGYPSGLMVDGSYASLTSNVNVKAYGVLSGGGYGSNLTFSTSSNATLAEVARFTKSGNLLIGTTTDAASLSGGLVINGSGAGAAASSTTTGALRVTGGVGVSGAGYFGGSGAFGGTLKVTDATGIVAIGSGTAVSVWKDATPTKAAQMVFDSASNETRLGVYDGSSWAYGFRMSQTTGNVSFPATTPSTLTTNGALVVTGGVGVGGALNVGGNSNSLGFVLNRTNNSGHYTGTSDNYGFTWTGTNGEMSTATGSMLFKPANTTALTLTNALATFANPVVVGGGLATLGRVDVAYPGVINVPAAPNVTTDLFGYGDGTRHGLIRGNQNGANIADFRFGYWASPTFTESFRVTTSGSGVSNANTAVNIYGTSPSTGVGSGALQVAGGIYAGAASVFGGTVKITDLAQVSGSFPQIIVNNSGEVADARRWQLISVGSALALRSTNDADSSSSIGFSMTRTGANITGLQLGNSGTSVTAPGDVSIGGANGLSITKGTAAVRSIVAGGSNELYQVFPNTATTTSMSFGMGSNSATAPYINTTASLTSIYGAGGTLGLTVGAAGAATFAGIIKPQQATTAGAPAYVKGAIYFDTTLNKLRVGGATAWETITSV